MHRTRTTTALLAILAVSAVSGCVTVQARPSPASLPARTGVSRGVAPQIVQSPVREALEAALPPAPASRQEPSAPPAARDQAADAPAADPARRPRHTSPEGTDPALPVPSTGIVPAPVVGTGDVCALGQGFGGWRPDSPEARICRQTYG
ncbi:hypothetical protein GCM10020367_08860 [Streptomyces sannanensis]|uniref:Lipoprotein n=1 Tax=Streptomyces sannanensis TaxID=285536 RepID=A0ABP6S5M2_9ACTN